MVLQQVNTLHHGERSSSTALLRYTASAISLRRSLQHFFQTAGDLLSHAVSCIVSSLSSISCDRHEVLYFPWYVVSSLSREEGQNGGVRLLSALYGHTLARRGRLLDRRHPLRTLLNYCCLRLRFRRTSCSGSHRSFSSQGLMRPRSSSTVAMRGREGNSNKMRDCVTSSRSCAWPQGTEVSV